MARLIVVRRATIPLLGKVAGWPDAASTLQCLPVSLPGVRGKGVQHLPQISVEAGMGQTCFRESAGVRIACRAGSVESGLRNRLVWKRHGARNAE